MSFEIIDFYIDEQTQKQLVITYIENKLLPASIETFKEELKIHNLSDALFNTILNEQINYSLFEHIKHIKNDNEQLVNNNTSQQEISNIVEFEIGKVVMMNFDNKTIYGHVIGFDEIGLDNTLRVVVKWQDGDTSAEYPFNLLILKR